VHIEGDFMDIDKARTGDVRPALAQDPRARLMQEKFFTLRPKPLERWLWRRRVPAAAERVFWFHWSEGARNGDWCSQFALHFIARQCEVDPSTVTRAYQLLKRLGLIRRVDPGRDADNPFEQATCITEVLLPQEVLAELQASPNRPSQSARRESPHSAKPEIATGETPQRPAHPHAHLDLKAKRERLKALAAALSPGELERWNKAICGSARAIEFDADTQVPSAIRAEILQYLAAREAPNDTPAKAPPAAVSAPASARKRLSAFDIARLRAGLQRFAPLESLDELTRQALWSIEAGALKHFEIKHAINIALKKVREGAWTRPYRMPPNWLRKVSSAQPEACSRA
jgi:hypothetical protein